VKLGVLPKRDVRFGSVPATMERMPPSVADHVLDPQHAGHLAGAALAIALVTPTPRGVETPLSVMFDPRRADAPMSVMFDLGQAAENMMLAAWELGIGSVQATVYEPDLVRRLIGFPRGYTCEFLLSFGYPADPDLLTRPPRPGGRKPLESIVHEERW